MSGTQEDLAAAALKTNENMHRTTEATKLAAGLISDDSNSQISLLNAAKGVASSLVDVLDTAKTAAGKPSSDPEARAVQQKAKEAAKTVEAYKTNATKLREQTGKATQSLQNTIDAIAAELQVYDSDDVPFMTMSPEDLLHLVNGVMIATAKAVSCLLYTSPSPRDRQKSRMPSSA